MSEKRMMKTTVARDVLVQALADVKPAVSKSGTLPVLSHVLLKKWGKSLTVVATNHDLMIVTEVEVGGRGRGEITVPAASLTDLVNLLPDQEIELTQDPEERDLHLACGGVKAKFRGLAGDEFPPLMVDEPEDAGLPLPADEFAEMVEQVAFAAAGDVARPTLTGVFMQVEDGLLTMVATDGFRLARTTREVEATGPVQVIVPATTLKVVARLAKRAETVLIQMEEKQMQFDLGFARVMCQLLVGNYPEYESVIPDDAPTRVVFGREHLQKAVRTAHVMARESADVVHMEMVSANGSDAHALVEAKSQELGNSRHRLPIAFERGENVQVALNALYVKDGLSIMPGEQVAIEVIDEHAPIMMRPADRDNVLYVVMPMRAGREE